jgi:serine/threonine-protein kinase
MLGKVLGNRYEIIEKIGEGGMALVYKARCRLLNRYVAIKVLKDEFVNDEEFIKKFRRESQAAASLSHPNIVSIYDVGMERIDDHDVYYIVMEYIKGKTLKGLIKEKRKLSVEETIDYSIQIAEALEHAHKNHIVHRDIKPHNIMITEDGRVKVTDFGIARAATFSTVTNTSTVVGSVHYFSPEQARGRYTDEKSDIYSLGIVMYEMITGKVPFEGDSPISVALKHIQEEIVPPREIDSSIPVGLQNIILKCVKKNQSDRYSSATQLLSDLRKLKYSNGNVIIGDLELEDEPTRIIPRIENEDDNEMKQQNVGNKRKEAKDGGLKVIFLAIVLAFIVVSSLALGFFKFKDYFIAKEVTVPDLVGIEKDEAEEELEKIGLKLRVVDETYSNEYEEGVIVSQKVEPGTKVKEGYTIEVVVSKGKQLVKVPNLINRNIEEIESILKEAGLKEGTVDYQYSDTIPANVIIDQDPDPFAEVEFGSRVNLIVSRGPEVKLVRMPNLVGLTEQAAKNALIAHELVVGEIIREHNDEYKAGVVFKQSIEAGTQVEANTPIDLYISLGAKEEPKDEEPGESEEIPIDIRITPESENEQVEIRIDRIQDGKRQTVYRNVVETTGKELKIRVTGKKGSKFEIYQDGELIKEIQHPGK